jgi:hypothetical protein
MFFDVYDDARLDPGRAFRLVVKVDQFVLETEYGEYGGAVDIAEQQHEMWFDMNSQYSSVHSKQV